MRQRIGFYSIKKYGHLMCKFITQYGPIIKVVFPEAENLHKALDAAYLACQALTDEINLVQEPGV